MSDDEDQNDVDISVIRKAIEISGNMIEQILKGIHYGSPEVRCLLYSECDYIIECKVCRNLFRSLANFVAHKRAYCTIAFQQSDDYLNLVQPDEETVVVHPEMPEDTKQQKQKKPVSRSLENTVQQLKDGTLGHSAAYKLYSQAADKIDQQREAAKTQTLTFEPIPNTTKAMKVTVTPGVPEPMEETLSVASEASDTSNPSTSKLTPLQSSPTATLKSMLLKSALEGNNPESLTTNQNSPEKVSVKQNPKAMLSPPKKMTLRCKEGIKSMPWKKGRADSESPCHESRMDFNTLECLDCNTAFRSKKTLVIHYQNAHCGKRTFFPCPYCESVFFYIFGLTRHLMKAHNKTKQQIDKMRDKLKKNSFVKEVTEQCLSAREQIQHVKNTTVTSRGQTETIKSDPNDIIQSACFQTPSKEDHVCSNCGREFAKKLNLLNHRKICLTEGCTSVTNTVSKSVTTVRKSPVFTSSSSQSSCNSSSKSESTPVNSKTATQPPKKSTTVVITKTIVTSEEKVPARPSRSSVVSKSLENEETSNSSTAKDEKIAEVSPPTFTKAPEVKSEPIEVRRPLVKTTARNTGCKFSRRVVSPPPPSLLPSSGLREFSQPMETTQSTETQEKKPIVKTTARSKKGFKPRVTNPPLDIDQLVHSGITSSLDGSDQSDDETDIKPDVSIDLQDPMPASVIRKSNPNSEIKDETNSEFASVKRKSNVVEEIWVDKLPGLPTEKVRSNRTYVMKSNTHQKLECQDTKRLREIVNETELVCMHCSLEFSNVSNLRRHAIRHLGWKRYKCKMCKFSSYNKSECNTHLIRTHSDRFRNVSSINSLIVDLGKEGSKVRSRKKQQTLFERQAAECAEAGEDVYVTDTSYKRSIKKGKTEESKVSPPMKKRLKGDKGSEITRFNISTRNSPREFDIRPYKKVDPTTTLCTRKSSYPKKITINSTFHDEDDSDEDDVDSHSPISQSSKFSKSDSFYTASQNSVRSKGDVSDTDSEMSVLSRNKLNVKSAPSGESPQTRRSTRVGQDSNELKAARNITPDLLTKCDLAGQ